MNESQATENRDNRNFEELKTSVEKLTCEFVLSDVQAPETIRKLLPILKKVHSQCRNLGLKPEAEDILKARDMINQLIDGGLNQEDGLFEALEAAVNDFSQRISIMSASGGPDKDRPVEETDPPAGNGAEDRLGVLEKKLDDLDHAIGAICPGQIPDLGALITLFDSLVKSSKDMEQPTFYEVSVLCKSFVDNLGLEDITHTKPVEEAAVLLKSILSHLRRGEPFAFDYSDVVALLEENMAAAPVSESARDPEPSSETDAAATLEKIPDDDLEIMYDFISEARENLESIEVNLIELEQDPENSEIINEIFRPFHTIKGVSGFLSLTKINRLAHTTENLLDGARSGDFVINQSATDAILESVDTLKRLVERVQAGTQTGFRQPDDDIPVEDLRKRLEQLQGSLTNGESEPIGEILVKQKAITRTDLEDALTIQKTKSEKKIGEILVEENRLDPEAVSSALQEQSSAKRQVDAQVKVSTQKLDDLVDYAGELVIAQSMLRQKTANDPLLNQTVAQLGLIVNNMQNIAMSMRMIPIKATFMKMIRLVRDLSKKSGKNVKLSMSGEDTEIDRNVVDALYEPMVHMIRNSVDHGIEKSEERESAGKQIQGNIYLRAYHKGGNIVIEIEDDGKGLDRERILEKAIKTGLITSNEQMTDPQIFDLIMQPGFSTAKEITDVSGRGVGMDVVKDGIEKFRGHLNIESEKGKGTKFTIRLPLTLAIIDGMLVRVDEERYVIPTIVIQKAFRPGPDEYFTVEGKGEMVKDRGSLIPLIRLSEIYKTGTSRKPVEECLVVVVESKEEKRALLIDELLGKDEYVIKSLGGGMEDVQGISGGAILADGRVGLILDIHGIFSIVARSHGR